MALGKLPVCPEKLRIVMAVTEVPSQCLATANAFLEERKSERAITGISFRKMAMKKYWMIAVVGYVLLLAALGFALDLGIVAIMLRS